MKQWLCAVAVLMIGCGDTQEETLAGCDLEYVKPNSHEKRILMIMDRLKQNNEFIVEMFMGDTPVELRSVDRDKDGKKDMLVLVGSPGLKPAPGNMPVYLIDDAKTGFGKIDIVRIGRDINGYLHLEEKKELDQEMLDAVDSLYFKAVDLGADVILHIDEIMDIRNRRELDEESLKGRHVDDEIEILTTTKK